MALFSYDTYLQNRNTGKVYWPVLSSLYHWIILICIAMIQNQGKCTLRMFLMCLKVEGGGMDLDSGSCSARGKWLNLGRFTLGNLKGRRKLWFTLVTQFLVIFQMEAAFNKYLTKLLFFWNGNIGHYGVTRLSNLPTVWIKLTRVSGCV